jgi:ribonuclease P protein component
VPKIDLAHSPQRFRFPKQLRLNQAADFKTIFRVGKKQTGRHLAFFVKPNNLPYPRLGLVIAKKAVRQAVVRNRIKRVLREGFRVRQQALHDVDVIAVVYQGIAALAPIELRRQIDTQWEKLISCKKV